MGWGLPQTHFFLLIYFFAIMYKNKVQLNLLMGIIFLIFFCQAHSSWANVRLARIFSSDMVLQQGIENTIWGWADKGEMVSISINGKTITTKTGKDGTWVTKLPAMDYGGPYKMLIKAKNAIEFENVMVGEVWICSGQSNMEFTVKGVNHAEDEIAEANYSNIRLFTVPKKSSQTPSSDLEAGSWEICTPKTITEFSAVGYFFGRKIFQEMNVAVGLINTSWGGTVAETWTSSETIKDDPDFAPRLKKLQKMDIGSHEDSIRQCVKLMLGEFPSKDNGLELKYNQPDLDDQSWNTVKIPQLWEAQGYDNFDGIAWYRKTIDLEVQPTQGELILSLGSIDDSDICWVNGIQVGKTNGHNLQRNYVIPASVLKTGKNTIAVKATDTGGLGGFYGKDEDVFLRIDDRKINLSGEWKMRFTEILTSSIATKPNDYPTLLFNGMISPIIPYGIKGAIWYQGESNTSRAKQYQRIFPNMITDWRNHWQLGDFPFFWVQLANFTQPLDQPGESTWAELREAQTMTLKLPNTGMALAIDLGEANDIHPRNKQDVGLRLALNALKTAYSKNVACTGPAFKLLKVEGSRAIISFSTEGSILKVNNKYGYINGFSLAGDDRKFHWAKAEILNNNSVVIYADEVKIPEAVRYGWADNPDDLNLYNEEGLPAIPFRTDNWPCIIQ